MIEGRGRTRPRKVARLGMLSSLKVHMLVTLHDSDWKCWNLKLMVAELRHQAGLVVFVVVAGDGGEVVWQQQYEGSKEDSARCWSYPISTKTPATCSSLELTLAYLY
jgi:hypothetical protein